MQVALLKLQDEAMCKGGARSKTLDRKRIRFEDNWRGEKILSSASDRKKSLRYYRLWRMW